MANPTPQQNAARQNSTTIAGSLLGEYYCKLSIGPYSRPKPFEPSKMDPKVVLLLPLPSEMRDDTAVGYTNMDLNTVGDLTNGDKGIAAGVGMRKAGDIISGGAANLLGAAGGAGAGALFGDKFGSAAQSKISDTVGDLFPPDQVASALQQSMGMAPNPNPSVMFTGPQLREFTFSWTFYPKNAKESANLKKMIETLKGHALPSNSIGGSAAILTYPSMCQMNFYPWDGGGVGNWGWTSKSIIRMKKCVMASVNANYTPSNVPAFFHGTNAPVAVQLTINLKEIEYMMANDYTGADWKEGLSIADVATRGLSALNPFGAALEPVEQPPADGTATDPTTGAVP